MNKLAEKFKQFEPDKEKSPFMHTLFDGFFTFFFTPNKTTSTRGVQIRDGMDLKRTMVFVVLALQLCYIFGTYNIGHQHFVALGLHEGFLEGFHLKLLFGLGKLLPIFIVTHVVGLAIEFYFATKKGHPIEEGFLVSGALIPLIMPPDIPLWILAVSVAFAVIIGKEAFGGTGMNIWNVALLARVFVFFAYPTTISGDQVWVAGLTGTNPGSAVDYNWFELNLLNPIFENFGWATFNPQALVMDGYTGATPLGLAAYEGWSGVQEVYTKAELFWGTIPGSIGETSKPLIIAGMAMLLVTGIASWRIILSLFLGALFTAALFNAWGATEFLRVPWLYQFYMGSFLFAMAFMATDPVTASGTNKGKYIYGFLIGVIGMIVRVLNPAYPEGWMLAILFMNTFAPLIDHYVLSANMKKRLQSA